MITPSSLLSRERHAEPLLDDLPVHPACERVPVEQHAQDRQHRAEPAGERERRRTRRETIEIATIRRYGYRNRQPARSRRSCGRLRGGSRLQARSFMLGRRHAGRYDVVIGRSTRSRHNYVYASSAGPPMPTPYPPFPARHHASRDRRRRRRAARQHAVDRAEDRGVRAAVREGRRPPARDRRVVGHGRPALRDDRRRASGRATRSSPRRSRSSPAPTASCTSAPSRSSSTSTRRRSTWTSDKVAAAITPQDEGDRRASKCSATPAGWSSSSSSPSSTSSS